MAARRCVEALFEPGKSIGEQPRIGEDEAVYNQKTKAPDCVVCWKNGYSWHLKRISAAFVDSNANYNGHDGSKDPCRSPG
jgi:hypothetical protein